MPIQSMMERLRQLMLDVLFALYKNLVEAHTTRVQYGLRASDITEEILAAPIREQDYSVTSWKVDLRLTLQAARMFVSPEATIIITGKAAGTRYLITRAGIKYLANHWDEDRYGEFVDPDTLSEERIAVLEV